MIKSKKELKFYLQADMMMNRGRFRRGIIRILYEIFFPDNIMLYLIAMRHYSYYVDNPTRSIWNRVIHLTKKHYWHRRFLKYGYRTGFSIGEGCLGYGCVLHHYGTIVIGKNNRIGNYALINTSTCITQNGTKIGDAFFMGTGAIIIKKIELGDSVSIGGNSVVNQSFPNSNTTIVGSPAHPVKESKAWYESFYDKRWNDRVEAVELLKRRMCIK